VTLNLSVARQLFDTLRSSGRIRIKPHTHRDHPERKFTVFEVYSLVVGKGHLKLNHVGNPAPDSFVWQCKDDLDRNCELAVVFDTDESGDLIVVISAFREVSGC
jgi:hypothetical protein